jgi:hypothetical protein
MPVRRASRFLILVVVLLSIAAWPITAGSSHVAAGAIDDPAGWRWVESGPIDDPAGWRWASSDPMGWRWV